MIYGGYVRGILIALIVGFSSGCASDSSDPLSPGLVPPGVAFEVDRELYGPGDTITVLLRNDSSETFTYNLCHAPMEARLDGGWQSVSRKPAEESFRFCPDVLYALAEGEGDTETQTILEHMESGVYRFRTRIGWGDSLSTVTTNEFRLSR